MATLLGPPLVGDTVLHGLGPGFFRTLRSPLRAGQLPLCCLPASWGLGPDPLSGSSSLILALLPSPASWRGWAAGMGLSSLFLFPGRPLGRSAVRVRPGCSGVPGARSLPAAVFKLWGRTGPCVPEQTRWCQSVRHSPRCTPLRPSVPHRTGPWAASLPPGA